MIDIPLLFTLPTTLGWLDLPSYTVGIMTGGIGVLLIFMIKIAKSRKKADSMIATVIQRLGTQMAGAEESAAKGNYGEAASIAEKAVRDLKGFQNELALEETLDDDNAVEPEKKEGA